MASCGIWMAWLGVVHWLGLSTSVGVHHIGNFVEERL
jgi:hypothetical protein